MSAEASAIAGVGRGLAGRAGAGGGYARAPAGSKRLVAGLGAGRVTVGIPAASPCGIHAPKRDSASQVRAAPPPEVCWTPARRSESVTLAPYRAPAVSPGGAGQRAQLTRPRSRRVAGRWGAPGERAWVEPWKSCSLC